MSASPRIPRRLLITAGPTHEPIDAVRYIGNRSSGRMGTSLAREAHRRGWHVTLLLGPASVELGEPAIDLVRFRSCDDLQRLLRAHIAHADILIMAAAVADFRPASPSGEKIRRTSHGLTLDLEPTPDLLQQVASSRPPGLWIVGFALEPRDRLLESAREKLGRKKADMIVANPLETMDSDRIEAVLLDRLGHETHTPGIMDKSDFSRWLLDEIERQLP